MPLQPRLYSRPEDLSKIGQFIRRAYAQDPCWNAWSFARWDIWAQRRLADEAVLGQMGWRRNIALWENSQAKLLGAAWLDPFQGLGLATSPEHLDILPSIVDWIEDNFLPKIPAGRAFQIEVRQENPLLAALLASRGYEKEPIGFNIWMKDLDPNKMESVELADGLQIKTYQTTSGLYKFFIAVHAVFHILDSLPIYRYVQQASSYVGDLQLGIESPSGDLVAFCSAWIDEDNNLAEFEQVGVLPTYRQQGLGTALLSEAQNRLRVRQVRVALARVAQEASEGNQLFESVGMARAGYIYRWSVNNLLSQIPKNQV